MIPDMLLDWSGQQLKSGNSYPIEFGIPAYKSLDRALAKAVYLRSVYSDAKIHVSVNGVTDVSVPVRSAELCKRLKVKLSIFRSDIGLYGNFRYLAMSAENKYFSWLALDDLTCVPKWEAPDDEADLVVPRFEYREYHFDSQSWGEVVLSSPPAPSRDRVFSNEYHGFMGLWSSEFLQKVFPKSDFDWLDTFLLDSALLLGKVEFDQRRVQTIGWWPPSEIRTKNYVNGTHLAVGGWVLHSMGLIFRSRLLRLIPRILLGLVQRLHRVRFDKRRSHSTNSL